AETWQLRKNSSVYIINSTHESLPISVLTSLSSGIPIIATNVSGIREVVYHEKTGLLVESGDIEGIAKSIIRFFEDENLRKSVVENGKILLKERFSWEVHLSNLNKLLSDSLKKTS
ncbi:MAG: glycosyltransferase family 4 protein, partial [Candidatus Pacebacteria bacterium]|nr:glycosyltransferase family 4 protein [Candidatus Paceibacterota bacterium]